MSTAFFELSWKDSHAYITIVTKGYTVELWMVTEVVHYKKQSHFNSCVVTAIAV